MTHTTTQEGGRPQDQILAAQPATDSEPKVDTESMTLSELLDYRYSLPEERRGEVQASSSIASDPRAMLLWSFHCVFQDRPLLVMLGCSVVLYHAFKFAIYMVKTLI